MFKLIKPFPPLKNSILNDHLWIPRYISTEAVKNMTPPDKPSYEILGVSHQKEDVHAALKNVDQGLYPHAFCKIIEDIAQDPTFCSVVHADGAGTKSSIAYLMYKQTGNLKYFSNLAQDSVVMNTDDVLCVGAKDVYLLSNTIGRNKKLISKDIVGAIIHGYEQFLAKLQKMGLNIRSCGGETADIGDLVRTIVVDSTLIARMKRTDVINPERIQAGDVIVGLSSAGQATYEEEYNSGIGSNGLTLARHGLLGDQYKKFEECYSPEIDPKWVFFGTHQLTDLLPDTPLTIGDALLSPTRTYAPILLKLFNQDYSAIHAIYHNTGGAQSKCLKYGCGLHYIKDRMFPIPSIFTAIQQSSHTPWKEMYQVFNMGHRMEIVCPEQYAREEIIPIAQSFGVQAQIVGRVEKNPDSTTNQLTIQSTKGVFNYHSTPC